MYRLIRYRWKTDASGKLIPGRGQDFPGRRLLTARKKLYDVDGTMKSTWTRWLNDIKKGEVSWHTNTGTIFPSAFRGEPAGCYYDVAVKEIYDGTKYVIIDQYPKGISIPNSAIAWD